MNKLQFRPRNGLALDRIKIFNNNEQYLGEIKACRVGQFLQWVYCPVAIETTGDFWLTGPCQDEIRTYHKSMTKRYGRPSVFFLHNVKEVD